jgi:Domain of unknown function (DUF4136)
MTSVCALIVLLLGSQAVGEVASSFDKKANFGAFRTYAWAKGHDAYDPTAHKTIIDAVDAQMAGLGFTKAAPESADVVVRYYTLRSADVDLKLLEKMQREGQKDPAPVRMLGRLVVALYEPTGTRPLWEAHTKGHLSEDPAKRVAEIQKAVASVFEEYPGRKKKGDD